MACTHAPAELLLIIILGEVAIGWEYVVCDLSEVFCLRVFLSVPTNDGGVNHKSVVSDDFSF